MKALNPRQAVFVEGIADGKSIRAAALDAGYSETHAERGVALTEQPVIKNALRKLLPSVEKIAARINEGMDAVKTETAKFEGHITDTQEFVDFGERRNYLELALRLHGLIDDPKEASTNGNIILIGNSQVAIKEG